MKINFEKPEQSINLADICDNHVVVARRSGSHPLIQEQVKGGWQFNYTHVPRVAGSEKWDKPLTREEGILQVEEFGYQVQAFTNLEDALDWAKNKPRKDT